MLFKGRAVRGREINSTEGVVLKLPRKASSEAKAPVP